MNRTIDMEQLKDDAEYIFTHGYACSESVIDTIKKHFDVDIPDDAIAMSSGFPWGLDSGCLCGALAGGTMCLGYFFGRRSPGEPQDKILRLTKELHDDFQQRHGATCCRVLTRGMERTDPKRKAHCIEMVRDTVQKTAEIILREA